LFAQSNKIVFSNNTHSFKGGVDYFINQKSTIGAMVNGSLAKNDITTSGPMNIIYLPTQTLNRTLVASSTNSMKRDNVNGNLNYRYAVTGGTELNIDADYGYFKIRGNQMQPNTYYAPDGYTILSQTTYNMIAPTDINLYSAKADYEQNYKGGRLGI